MNDRAQRQAAVDPARSVIVQAPAGSGKTTLLVERFLALLGVVEEPEQILAITFTRKAAAEMRTRILKFLEPGFETPAANSSPPHEQAALEKARAIADRVAHWNLAANPERLMIRTIDSFSHFLARSMPVASRLGPVPQPADNTAALYRRAARRVLDSLGRDEVSDELETLLDWRDHRTQELEDLLVSLLGKREQWLRALGLTGQPDRTAFERVLEAVVVERLGEARETLAAALAAMPGAADELAGLLAFAAGTLRDAGKASDLTGFDADRGLPGADAGDSPQWQALAEALLTRGGEWRKSVSIATGFPPKSREKERFLALLEALSGHPELADRLHAARRLPAPRYADDEWRALSALIRVLERAAAELELVFAEAGQTDFTGLSRAALTGLGDEDGGFTDLALYLDSRIDHILVDEYQDTNWAQFHLLEKLTHGWQPGDGRTLFVVGDPMQSIYRFREAEVGLFMRTRSRGLNAIRLEPLHLTRNFRSHAEIVDWVNGTLGPAFPAAEDITAGAVTYAPSEAGRGPGGAVEVIARAEPAAEAEAIAETIERELAAHSEVPGWKAAIIVRARSHLAEILPALQRRGVRFRAVKLDPLLDRPVVQDLHALARAVLEPADRTSLLAVLRSPVCGLTLAELHALSGDGANPVDDNALDRLPEPARTRAARVFGAVADARALAGRRPLRQRVEGAWIRLGGPQALERTGADRADVQMYLDALEAAESQGLLDDWNDFLEQLADAFTAGDPPNKDVRLEILTMHGAKGLEWDLVVLPGLSRGIGGSGRELLYWLPFTPADGEEQVLLAPLRAAWQPENTALIDLIRDERARREACERQRLLYVAATRAREKLVLSTVLDPAREPVGPSRGSLLELLWPRAGGEFLASLEAAAGTAPEADPDSASEPDRPDQSLRRVPDGWQPPIGAGVDWAPALPPREREIEIEFNWAGTRARNAGTVLHALLEQVGRIGIEALDERTRDRLAESIPNQLRALGTGGDALAGLAQSVREAFERTLESETGRWILSGEHRDPACELGLTGIVDGELVNAVIDRTFIDAGNTRWIIDYKSGYHAGGDLEGFLADEAERYESQLALYRRLFEQMGETEIRTALYLPRHGALREV
ncbi:MAG: UvrD-helicase domain-containing protein [Wenzhouxiangellaceae bacterium]|nr:UvrD-helicase domain-containing protein [Wenzhouxiangellaceae bacterium]